MSLLVTPSWKVYNMSKVKTKFNGEIEWEIYQNHLIKSVFKILPLMEEKKNWKKYLEGLLVEMSGLDIMSKNLELTVLMNRLQGLESVEDSHDIFKKTIFDCIDLIKKIQPE